MLPKDMYKNAHNSIKSPKLETQLKYPSTVKWINKGSNIYGMENYTACKWAMAGIQNNMDEFHRQNVKWKIQKSVCCELLFI